jgi:hypothetical protein
MKSFIETDILLFLNIIFSTFLIYGVELFHRTNRPIYLILTIILTNFLIYLIYKMLVLKYNLLQIAITGKILPVVILAFLSIFIEKTEPLSFINIFAISMVLIGSFILLK